MADIVDESVPLLIGLDVMLYHILILDICNNELRSGHFEWSLPINYSKGHVFILFNKVSIFYATRTNKFTSPFFPPLHKPHQK